MRRHRFAAFPPRGADRFGAVVDPVGAQNRGDVDLYGGFGQFVYYTDTCKFYQRNKKDIIARLKEQASDFGHKSVTEMVKSFNSCADADEDEIGRALFGRPRHDETTVENCLAWYALEEVARGAEDLEEG